MGEHKWPKQRFRASANSISNREAVLASSVCGCFCCCEIFLPKDFTAWTDFPDRIEYPDAPGRTALCPHCGVDSVLGDSMGVEISRRTLERLRKGSFGK